MSLHAIDRYAVQESPAVCDTGLVPFDGFQDLMERRFQQAIAAFRRPAAPKGPSGTIASALRRRTSRSCHQTLADQVLCSVRNCRGNRWMFRVGHVDEHPIRIHARPPERESADALFPVLLESTPVRLDLSHSAWSDIFFLGMDYLERAGVLNISVDLGRSWSRRSATAPHRDASARSPSPCCVYQY